MIVREKFEFEYENNGPNIVLTVCAVLRCEGSFGFAEQQKHTISKNLRQADRKESDWFSAVVKKSFLSTPSTIFITGAKTRLAPLSSVSPMRWAMCFREGRMEAEAAMTPREAMAASAVSLVNTPGNIQAMLACTQ